MDADPRAVSTVLDVCLCLLLVGAAVATVAQVPTGPPPEDEADEAATVVATGTATVRYSLVAPPGVDRPRSGPAFERVAHGRYTTLLADATVAALSVEGRRVTRTRAPFVAGVRNATAGALANASVTGQVIARWRPYPDAPVGGTVVAGGAPPPDATVHAARTTVPSGAELDDDAESDTFREVAVAVARAMVARLFPRESTRLALAGDHPTDALVRHRYRRATGAFAAGERGDPEHVAGLAARRRVGAANEWLAGLLATRLERDLRARYDSPAAARRAVTVDRVTIVVRTWSA